MAMTANKNRQHIVKIIELLISKKAELRVQINGQKDPFTSRLIKMASTSVQPAESNTPAKRALLIMEKLSPAKGNNLIKSSPDIVVDSVLGDVLLRFRTRYWGISSDYPHFGMVVGFPETLEFDDLRKESRIIPSIPDFIYVQFDLKMATGIERSYELDVIDCSRHGLGLLVTEKDIEVLRILKTGDRINDVTFFASWTMIKVDATVKHKSKIETGEHKGLYILGIESGDIIENCKPPEK